MTHTLHRQGSEESLTNDFVIMAMPEPGVNSKGSLEVEREMFKIFMKYNPINSGCTKHGSRYSLKSDDNVYEAIEENEGIHAVYKSREDLIGVLKELKEKHLGLSVIVSGLTEHSCQCAKEAGITPHTIAESLGIIGKLDALPDPHSLEINTMCGHGLVSFNLIQELAKKIKDGKMTSLDAGKKLASCCVCGVFNPERAARIIDEMIK
jgi:hypothetical protein